MKKLNWFQRFLVWLFSPPIGKIEKDCTCGKVEGKCVAPIYYTYHGFGRWDIERKSNELWKCGKVQQELDKFRQ